MVGWSIYIDQMDILGASIALRYSLPNPSFFRHKPPLIRYPSSCHTPNNLLRQSRNRTFQAGLPRPKDDATVCIPPLRLLLLTHDSDLATFKSTYRSLLDPNTFKTFACTAIESVRTGNKKDLVFIGVLSAEILGFFTVGEIIGRRKLIGYRGATGTHH